MVANKNEAYISETPLRTFLNLDIMCNTFLCAEKCNVIICPRVAVSGLTPTTGIGIDVFNLINRNCWQTFITHYSAMLLPSTV